MSMKNSNGTIGIFFKFKYVYSSILYNNYIVLTYRLTSTTEGSLADETTMCVTCKLVSNHLWKDVCSFRRYLEGHVSILSSYCMVL